MTIRNWLATAALLTSSGLSPDAGAQDPFQLLQAGTQLSPEAAAALERLLADEPEHQALRSQLIGYYGGFDRDMETQGRQIEHVMWLIRNQPRSQVLASPEVYIYWRLQADAQREASSGWSQHLERAPEDLGLLRNASEFYQISDPELAIELLERA